MSRSENRKTLAEINTVFKSSSNLRIVIKSTDTGRISPIFKIYGKLMKVR